MSNINQSYRLPYKDDDDDDNFYTVSPEEEESLEDLKDSENKADEGEEPAES